MIHQPVPAGGVHAEQSAGADAQQPMLYVATAAGRGSPPAFSMNKIAIVRSGEQQAGDITIDSQFVILDRSPISADAFGGPGGNVKVSARYLS